MTVLVCIAYFGVPIDLLDKAVRSVLAQTHDDIRLVVIGDGQEPPLDVEDDRLTVFTLPENRGPYFCQAVVIAASPHEWYATVGADDWVERDHLETMLATGGSSVAPSYWNGDRLVRGWAGEFGVTRTDRLREIGSYNPAERIAQDTLTMRLLAEHGGITRTPAPTYHYVRREGSLTMSAETRKGSAMRNAVHERNRAVLRDTRRMGLAEVRAYRAALIPARIRDEVTEQAHRLAPRLGGKVAA